jgi:hypothetical protein
VTPFTSHLSVKKCGRSPASSRAAAVYSEVLVRLLASLDAQDRRTSLVFELPPSADRQDCWHIYYGDVHAGTIAKRVGSPHVTDQWEWRCGLYPGSRPGEIRSGTSATFDDARAILAALGSSFFLTALMPIFRRGANNEIRPHGNMRCGIQAASCRLDSGNQRPASAAQT